MQSSNLARECEELAAQIAALRTEFSTPTQDISIPTSVNSPRTTHAVVNKPPLPPKSSRRFGHKTAPLEPTLSTGEVDPLSHPTTSVFVTEVRPVRQELQDLDAHLARVALPTPEAALKENPFSLPPRSATPARSRRASESGAYTEFRERLQDDETREAAKQQEELAKETSRTNESSRSIMRNKPLTLSVSERFTLEIIPDDKHTSIWDDVLGIDDTYAWPGKLIIVDNQPWAHSYTLSFFEDFSIQLDALLEPRNEPPAESSELAYAWQTNYSGYRVPSPAGLCDTPPIKNDRGIALDRRMCVGEPDESDEPRLWMRRFWVPIPLYLFARSEHRTFVCSAKVTVRDAVMTGEIVAERVIVSIERLICKRLLAGTLSTMGNTPETTAHSDAGLEPFVDS